MVAFMPRLKDSGVGTIDSGRRLFEILDSDLKAETFRRGTPQEYANGAYLIQQGEKADGIHIITVGTVESLYQSNLGRSLILATWEAGDFVGGPYVFGDHEHAWAARALGRVQALHLNQNQLKSFATESASFALAMIECLGYKGERYSKLAQNLATHNSTERLALLLAELAKHAPPAVDGTKRIGAIPQSKLAQMIGATRQSVAKSLQRLEANGIIVQEPTSIEITDPHALAQFGNSAAER